MKLFRPNIHLNSYKDVDFDMLYDRGFRTIFFDIDNTLVPHDVSLPDEELKSFIQKLKDKGFDIYTISNNSENRVKLFADAIGIKFHSMSLKPLKISYKKVIKENNLNKKEIVCIGDQLLTDMLGANRMGLFCIYTNPLVTRDINYTKINRVFEKIIIRYLNKHKLLEIGVIYE